MIKHIASRELKSLYATPVAWVLLAAAQLLLAWLLFSQLEVYLEIQPRLTAAGSLLGISELVVVPTLNIAALMLLLTVPLLGSRTFSGELQSGRINLLLSSPVSSLQLVLGKWLGLVLASVPLTLLAMLMTLTLGWGSDLDTGRLLGGTLGLLLTTCMAAAVSVWLSSITRQPMIAAALAYGALFLLWLLDSQSTGGPLSDLALLPHLQPFFKGLLETGNLVYFLSVSLLGLGLAMHRLWRLGGQPLISRWPHVLFYLLLTSCCMLMLQVGNKYQIRHDLSQDQQNSLHAGTLALLQNLQGPLALTAFVPDYPVMRAEIKNLTDKYAQAYPATKLEFIDPSSHPDMARQLGIRQVGEMLVEYNGQQEKLQSIDESGLSNAIARMSLDSSRWIVSVQGHGEASLHGKANFNLSEFNHKLGEKGYKSIDYQLSATGQIPQNAAMLLLAAPRTPLQDPEVQILLDYLEQGGNLLWLADDAMPQRLADYLEISFLPGIVVDAAAADLGIDTPAVAVINTYPDHSLTSALQGPVLLPHARAIQQQRQVSAWEAIPLLQTGSRSWNETGDLKGVIERQTSQNEVAGPLVLGYALTRRSTAGKEQRIIVIGDADFLSNAYLGNGANQALGHSIMHWLTMNDRLVSIPERQASDQHLHWSVNTTAAIALAYLLLLPLMLIASGLLIYWRRKRQ